MKRDDVAIMIIIIYMAVLPKILSVVIHDKIKKQINPTIEESIKRSIDDTFQAYNIIVE